VTKVAERNPQKLRQIGLNYDIANVKGLLEPTEEEKKKKQEATKKAADQKKKKEVEEAKEKEEFQMWKKEEKATYEAWKKEKMARDEKDRPKDTTNVPYAKKEATPSEVDKKEVVPTEAVKKATTSEDAEKETTPTKEVEKDDAIPKPDSDIKNTSGAAPASSPSLITERDGERAANASGPVDITSNALASAPAKDRVDDGPKSWNAVCVLGLRVYSKDAEVSIKIIKPKNVEEGAILDVDGDTAAGATM